MTNFDPPQGRYPVLGLGHIKRREFLDLLGRARRVAAGARAAAARSAYC
jgi:hypothetical protein